MKEKDSIKSITDVHTTIFPKDQPLCVKNNTLGSIIISLQTIIDINLSIQIGYKQIMLSIIIQIFGFIVCMLLHSRQLTATLTLPCEFLPSSLHLQFFPRTPSIVILERILPYPILLELPTEVPYFLLGLIVHLFVSFLRIIIFGLGDKEVDLIDGLDQQGQVVLLGIHLQDEDSCLPETFIVDDLLDPVIIQGGQRRELVYLVLFDDLLQFLDGQAQHPKEDTLEGLHCEVLGVLNENLFEFVADHREKRSSLVELDEELLM